MSDLIGRFLSFEEHLGRGLVKFAYYLALFFLVVMTLYAVVRGLFGLDFGLIIITLFQFLLQLVVLRVVAELALAILSIDDSLQNAPATAQGLEAGITPGPTPKPAPTPGPATTVHETQKPAPTPAEDVSAEGPTPTVDHFETTDPDKQ